MTLNPWLVVDRFVMKKIRKSLSEDEYVLVRKTKKSQMTGLDEDQLIDLHSRIRRARNKYVTLYRRAARRRKAKGGRGGAAKAANVHNAARAEAFEKALSRVSARLATVSREAARELRTERLDRARTVSRAPEVGPPDAAGKVSSAGRPWIDTTRESPGRKKYERRRQPPARDARRRRTAGTTPDRSGREARHATSPPAPPPEFWGGYDSSRMLARRFPAFEGWREQKAFSDSECHEHTDHLRTHRLRRHRRPRDNGRRPPS